MTGCASASGQTHATSKQTSTQKIIAVGDIHGDYDAYQSVMRAAGLVDVKGQWVGGKTIFVQTGDVPDRGPDSRKIIEHLQTIQKQARKQGGKVVALVGNHEAMNMTADLRYVHAGEYSAYVTPKSAALRDKVYKANKTIIETAYKAKDPTLTPDAIKIKWEATSPLGKLEHQAAWGPKGKVGKWVVKNPAVALINGNLFAHGGFSQKYTAYTISDMNKATKTALKSQDRTEESIIHDPLGPLWYRGLIPGSPQEGASLTPADEVDLILETYGAQRIIIGHTPERTGIKTSFDGKLIQIDTGMSEYYKGTRSFLRIENGSVYSHDDGVVQQIN